MVRPRWLDVVVGVEEHCRGACRALDLAEYGRVGAFDLEEPDIGESVASQHLGDVLGGTADFGGVEGGRAHRWNADHCLQLGED